MSTPPGKTPSSKGPFGLLSAILTGLVLGFFAVMMLPYILPPREPGQTLAQIPGEMSPALSRKPIGSSASLIKASDSAPLDAKARQRDPSLPSPAVRLAENEEHAGDSKAPEEAKPADERPAKIPAPPQSAKEEEQPKPVLIPAAVLRFPKPFSSEDTTAALEPLLTFKVSEDDAKAVKDAVEAASRQDDEDARASIKKISDPAAKIFAEWRRLRQSNADFHEAMTFRLAHPLFPEPAQDAVTEKSLFLSNAPGPDVLKFYTNRMPLTGAGHASLGAALVETGERERGLALLKFAWTRYVLDPAVEEKFQSKFGTLLDANDRVRRERLLAIHAVYKDDPGKKLASDTGRGGLKALARLKGKKAKHHGGRHGSGRAAHRKNRHRAGLEDGAGQREAALSGKARALGARPLAELVRLKKGKKADTADTESKDKDKAKPAKEDDGKPAAGTRQAKAAENAFKLSTEQARGPGSLLARLKALRREKADDDLWSLLRSIGPDKADLADPNLWWDFRRSEIRRALSQDRPKTAYAIARAHGPLEGDNLSEAEFFAGWIALRFLKDPHRALPHFEASRVIGFARNEARAAYWLGRAKVELRAPEEAQGHFAEAASRYYTYYGALARQALRTGHACEFRAPLQPSHEAIAAFVNEDAFKAVMIAKQLDLEPLLNGFVLDLARQIRDPEQMTLVMELAERVVPPHVAVRAAKIALLRGYAVEAYAYPTLLPKFDQAGGNGKLEPALLNALTRQESEFYTGTVSRVGARGLMQLMPETAKHIAAAVKMKYELPRLISDPSYNVTLGSAFLAQLLSGYDGSYVLSLAAYNAGPGRVSEWIKDFGDPRDKDVDPIDWVERIPFTETRQYVQKILESTQLYRCRFANSKTRFQLVEDLHRGRPGKIPDLTDISGSAGMDETP